MDAEAASDEPCQSFLGYQPPTSSTTYTPNQFFDVVLPNASRGCLRLVAYLIRKTLGWSDAQGNPQNPEATISYRELERCASIGRGRIKEAIDEAIASRYVECLRFGKPHQIREEGYSALYSLKWGTQYRYVTDSEEFDGFFAGNGNLTHIPNAFFDFTIPSESLAVVKVVGIVIRNTIGFQTKFGFRRQEASLSFSDIMRRTAIRSRTTVSEALKSAVVGNHIRVITPGCFDQNAGIASRATVYAVNWTDSTASIPRKVKVNQGKLTSKTGPRPQTAKDWVRGGTTPNLYRRECPDSGPANASAIGTATAPKLDRKAPRNWTAIKRTDLNNLSKQHQTGWTFAAHFYAELAGNREAPVAEPSSNEVRISEEFVRRMNSTEAPGDMGRDFARFVVKRSQNSRIALQTISLALRLHADPYFQSRLDSEAARRDQTLRRAKETHKARMAPKYAAFLSAIVRQHASDSGCAEDFKLDCKSKLESCRRLSERAHVMLRNELDSAEGKNRLFLEFLTRRHPSLVIDFWQWDANHNDKPFSPIGNP